MMLRVQGWVPVRESAGGGEGVHGGAVEAWREETQKRMGNAAGLRGGESWNTGSRSGGEHWAQRKHKGERLDLKERNANSLVVLVTNDLAGAMYHIKRLNHLAAGSMESQAHQQAPTGNLLQVYVSDAPVSTKLRPASQCTPASKTEIKHQNTSICHRMWPNVTPIFLSNCKLAN